MSLSLAQDYDYVSECPTDNGFFADALQCDRYYECKDGEVKKINKKLNVIFGNWKKIKPGIYCNGYD